MKVIKLLWIADRYHLRKYGRTVTGDEYLAMNYGPVASTTRDLIEKTEFLNLEEVKYSEQYIEPVGKYEVQSKKKPDLQYLAETDKEALNFSISKFGSLDQFELKDISHRYPEWKKVADKFPDGKPIREEMSLLDFFDNPNDGMDDKFKIDQDVLQVSKDIVINNNSLFEKLK